MIFSNRSKSIGNEHISMSSLPLLLTTGSESFQALFVQTFLPQHERVKNNQDSDYGSEDGDYSIHYHLLLLYSRLCLMYSFR